MKNVRYFIPLFACLFLMNACSKDDDTLLSRNNAAEKSADVVVLDWKDCYRFTNFEDITVCFSTANEYRCPCDVNCVWEGSVEYTLTVQTEDQETVVTLQPPGNPNNAPSSAVVGKSKISIAGAQPVNCADYGNFERYKLKVTVSAADPNNLGDPGIPEQEFLDKAVYHE